MNHSDLIYLLDQKYAVRGGTPVPCPNEGKQVKMQQSVRSEHGALGVHASGSYLVCGVCGFQFPTSNVE